MQIGLDAYPALVQAAITGTKFLSAYRDSLAEDIAVVMLWAGRDVVTANSEEVIPHLSLARRDIRRLLMILLSGNAEGAQTVQGDG